MFSRLCKNSIFPSGNSGGSGGSNGSSSGSGNTSGASNAASLSVAATGPSTSEPAHSSSRTSTPAASGVASSRRHLNLPLLPVLPPRSAAQIRPEPPPPYWAHYQHRVVPAASSAAVVVHPPIPLALGSSDSSRSSSSSSSSNSSSAAAAAVSNARRHQLRGTAAVYVGNVVTSDGFRRNHGNGGATLEQGSNQQGRGVAAAAAAAVIGQQRYNIARQQQQQQGQRIKEYFLSQDAFCPDLVRNCKITADPQSGRSSPAEPVPSSSSQPQPHSSSNNDPQDQDVYVEIEELNQSLAQLGAPSSTSPTSPSSSVATVVCGDMGQNLSIRRPKISLTWVLREQQQQQQQQTQRQHQQQNQSIEKSQSRRASPVKTSLVAAPVPPPAAPSSGSSSGHHHQQQLPARKKSRTRSKERLFSEKYVSDNNLTEYGYNEKLKAVVGGGASAPASTEHHGSSNSNGHHQHHHHNGVYRKSNRSYRKNSDRLRKKERSSTLVYPSLVQSETVDILLNNNNSIIINLNQDEQQLKSEKSLKNTYSEPSLYTTVSEPSSSKNRHRHRRRRERYHRTSSSSQSQSRFGYEIQNVDEFLSKCSLSSPGNIPVVLAAAATLYQTRPGSYQIEIPLPLGMVVNAVFKNQNWLYVQTPHAEEGYVAYETCLPLGILPPNQRSSSTSKPTPCWESTKDVFPRPSGNLTDSEKEIQQLRGNGSGSNAGGVGTRSEGRRTPRLKRTTNGTSSRSVASIACSSEKNLDSLYLRVANQPKSADSPQQSQFAQLKLTTKVLNGKSMAAAATAKLDKVLNIDQPLDKLPSNGDYIQLHKPMQHNPQQQNPFHHHHHHKILVKSGSGGSGHSAASSSALNGGHYHKTVNNLSYSTNPTSKGLTSAGATTAVRQTLLAITDSYSSESVSVQKGDVVTLLACKEYQEKGLKNYKQWFFVRTRDGHEGYIPAEAAGHGFL